MTIIMNLILFLCIIFFIKLKKHFINNKQKEESEINVNEYLNDINYDKINNVYINWQMSPTPCPKE